jgi:SEC-C motif-containing protein
MIVPLMRQVPVRSAPAVEADACPCGRPASYADCCGRYHAGALYLQAPDPESLMRSRYSAFVKDVRAYLLETWHPTERPPAIEPPEPGLRWLGLEVKRAGMLDEDRGWVEFVARSKWGGRAHRLHEVSEFVREGGRWFYLKARV